MAFRLPDAELAGWFVWSRRGDTGTPTWELTNVLGLGDMFRLQYEYEFVPFFAGKREVMVVVEPDSQRRDASMPRTPDGAPLVGGSKLELGPIEMRPDPADPKRFVSVDHFVAGQVPTAAAHATDADANDGADADPPAGPMLQPLPLRVGDHLTLWQADAWAEKPLGWADVDDLRPIEQPEVLVYKLGGAKEPLDWLGAWEPFKIEVRVPRAMAEQIGSELEVTLSAAKTGDDGSMTLGNYHAPAVGDVVIYTHEGGVTLAQGGEGGGRLTFRAIPVGTLAQWGSAAGDILGRLPGVDALTFEFTTGGLAKLSTENGDTLTVAYDKARTSFPVYDTPIQHSLAKYQELFDAAAFNYATALVTPNLPEREKQAAHNKLQLITNIRTILDVPSGSIDRFTDYTKLEACRLYFELLQTDPATWRRLEARRHRLFPIVETSFEENQTIGEALRRGHEIYEQRLFNTLGTALIGSYRVFASVTGTENVVMVIWQIDATGRRVNMAERLLAGLDIFFNALLQGAMTAKFIQMGRGEMSQRHAALAAKLKDQGLDASRYRLFNRPMTTDQMLDAVKAERAARRVVPARVVEDSGQAFPPGHPARDAARARDEARQLANQAQARRTMEDLGIDPRTADVNATVGVTRGLTPNEAAIGTAVNEGIPLEDVMRATGMSRDEAARALDRYFERIYGEQDVGARAAAVHRYMGDQTPPAFAHRMRDAETQAVPVGDPDAPAPAPAAAPDAPSPRPDASSPRASRADEPAPSPVSKGEQEQRVRDVFDRMGVEPATADFYAAMVRERGLRADDVAAGVAAGQGVPIDELMRATGMSRSQVAQAIDRYHALMSNVADPAVRARAVQRYMGEATPPHYRDLAAKAPPPPLPAPSTPGPIRDPDESGIAGTRDYDNELTSNYLPVAEVGPDLSRTAPWSPADGPFGSRPDTPEAAHAPEAPDAPHAPHTPDAPSAAGHVAADDPSAAVRRAAAQPRHRATVDDVVEIRGAVARQRLRDLGVDAGDAPLYGRDDFNADLGINDVVVGRAHAEGVPADRLLQRISADEAAAGLDRYLARRGGVGDPLQRAERVVQYLGDRAPKAYVDRVRRAETAVDIPRVYGEHAPARMTVGDVIDMRRRVVGDRLRELGVDERAARYDPDDYRAGLDIDDATVGAAHRHLPAEELMRRTRMSTDDLADRLDRVYRRDGDADPASRAQRIHDYLGHRTPPRYVNRLRNSETHLELDPDAPPPRPPRPDGDAPDTPPDFDPVGDTHVLAPPAPPLPPVRPQPGPRPPRANEPEAPPAPRPDSVPKPPPPPPNAPPPLPRRAYTGEGSLANSEWVDGVGRTIRIGDHVGTGRYFDVYRLHDNPNRVIKINKFGQEHEFELLPSVPPGHRARQAVVQSTLHGHHLVRKRTDIPTPDVHHVEWRGDHPYIVTDHLDAVGGTTVKDLLAKQGGKLTEPQQRAVLDLFKKLGRGELAWEDGSAPNIYLDRNNIAGILDTDRIATLRAPSPYASPQVLEMIAFADLAPGRIVPSLKPPPGHALGHRPRSFPSGDFWAEKMLEIKGWVQFRAGEGAYGQFIDGFIEIRIIREPKYFPDIDQHQWDFIYPRGDSQGAAPPWRPTNVTRTAAA